MQGIKGDPGPKGDPGSKDVPVITSGTSFPSTRKSGDMHWMTNSSGVVTGYYKFDGSQWVVQKVDAQALNVSSLSALSANLGNVTAGTINGVTINGSELITKYNDIPKETDVGTTIKVSGSIKVGDGAITNNFTYSGNNGQQNGTNVWTSDGFSGSAYDETGAEITRYQLDPSTGLIIRQMNNLTGTPIYSSSQLGGGLLYLGDDYSKLSGTLWSEDIYDSGWKQLAFTGGAITSPGNPVKIRRIGKMVYLTGDLRLPITTGYVWCTIPEEFRPEYESKYTTFAENDSLYRMIFWVHANGQISTVYNSQTGLNYHLAGTSWTVKKANTHI